MVKNCIVEMNHTKLLRVSPFPDGGIGCAVFSCQDATVFTSPRCHSFHSSLLCEGWCVKLPPHGLQLGMKRLYRSINCCNLV